MPILMMVMMKEKREIKRSDYGIWRNEEEDEVAQRGGRVLGLPSWEERRVKKKKGEGNSHVQLAWLY